MLSDCHPISQALLGTLFTWALTAAGAVMVVFFHGTQAKLLDTSLGFAAGVMTAASYWSLLAPAIEMAEESQLYGKEGQYAFIPAGVGFLLGALFTFAADIMISRFGVETPSVLLAYHNKDGTDFKKTDGFYTESYSIESYRFEEYNDNNAGLPRRRNPTQSRHPRPTLPSQDKKQQWKRILLLIIAITVHNIPEGLAVGVGFGAVRSTPSNSFNKARRRGRKRDECAVKRGIDDEKRRRRRIAGGSRTRERKRENEAVWQTV